MQPKIKAQYTDQESRRSTTIQTRMDHARIAELLHPFVGDIELTAKDLFDISTYIDILQRWNARLNLTAIRDLEQIVTRHFGESLFTARHLFPLRTSVPPVLQALDAHRNRPTLADVGTGAGFPGIPIKLWVPEVNLTLIESNHKKATFLREIARALTLTDIDIQDARAETLPPASFDTVTLRAVERFETILPVAASLVAPSGRLALLISSTQIPTAQPHLPGFTLSDPLPIPHSASRTILICHRSN